MTDKQEAIDRLNEIRDELKELAHEALRLVSEHGDKMTVARAESYWYPHIICELDKDHSYLAGSMCTLQSTISELKGGFEDDDE